jgi:hypothetical protein
MFMSASPDFVVFMVRCLEQGAGHFEKAVL